MQDRGRNPVLIQGKLFDVPTIPQEILRRFLDRNKEPEHTGNIVCIEIPRIKHLL